MFRTSLNSFTNLLNLGPSKEGVPSPKQLKTEVLSGLTVALALVPEAVAFAFVAGVHPLVGLYAAFLVGLITAIMGGRPGMISGATGALAVVMVALVAEHGTEYLFATVLLMGILQITAGALRWGKFIRLVPHPVMLGFVNGLAIVIFLAQLGQFQIAGTADTSHHSFLPNGEWLSGIKLYTMLGLTGLTMLIIWGTPKVTNIIPAPLVGILVVALLVIAFGLDTPRVGDLTEIAGGFPQFHVPFTFSDTPQYGIYGDLIAPMTLETLWIILPYAVILVAIGLIESLLTLNLVGEITGERGGASKECIAQGTANVVTGFFGGMGGCAMIGQSMINVKSGGRMRLSGIAAALFLLSFILFASSLIEQIPLAALVGVMFMVVIGTFAWGSIRLLTRVPFADALVIIIVTVVTVLEDLAIAVVVGVIVSALVYSWNAARQIRAISRPSQTEKGAKVYEISGPLFFGSATQFVELFDPKNDEEDHVILDFMGSRVVDQSALQAIEAVAAKYTNAQKRLQLRHLSQDCHQLLQRAGQLMIDSDDDPEYRVAVDYDVRLGRIGGH